MALVGDLTALADLGGLLAPDDERRPDLAVVVIDNDGGGIFSGLDAAAGPYADHFERVFGTPLGQDLVAIGEAMGVPGVRVRTPSSSARRWPRHWRRVRGCGWSCATWDRGSTNSNCSIRWREGSRIGCARSSPDLVH